MICYMNYMSKILIKKILSLKNLFLKTALRDFVFKSHNAARSTLNLTNVAAEYQIHFFSQPIGEKNDHNNTLYNKLKLLMLWNQNRAIQKAESLNYG